MFIIFYRAYNSNSFLVPYISLHLNLPLPTLTLPPKWATCAKTRRLARARVRNLIFMWVDWLVSKRSDMTRKTGLQSRDRSRANGFI